MAVISCNKYGRILDQQRELDRQYMFVLFHCFKYRQTYLTSLKVRPEFFHCHKPFTEGCILHNRNETHSKDKTFDVELSNDCSGSEHSQDEYTDSLEFNTCSHDSAPPKLNKRLVEDAEKCTSRNERKQKRKEV